MNLLDAIGDQPQSGAEIRLASGWEGFGLYEELWKLERTKLIVGEWEKRPYPRRRFYRRA